jgi:hypothetical protein
LFISSFSRHFGWILNAFKFQRQNIIGFQLPPSWPLFLSRPVFVLSSRQNRKYDWQQKEIKDLAAGPELPYIKHSLDSTSSVDSLPSKKRSGSADSHESLTVPVLG